jgi:hypothetical protein
VKKFLALLIFAAACAPKVTTTTKTTPVEPASPPSAEAPRAPNQTGGATARAAVEEFLSAVRAGDIQAMSVLFGTKSGPSRDNMSRDENEKRLVILQCYFNHDKSRILGESPGDDGQRVVEAELTKQGIVRTPSFYAVQGPSNRWYVNNMEIAAVRDFCRKAPGT